MAITTSSVIEKDLNRVDKVVIVSEHIYLWLIRFPKWIRILFQGYRDVLIIVVTSGNYQILTCCLRDFHWPHLIWVRYNLDSRFFLVNASCHGLIVVKWIYTFSKGSLDQIVVRDLYLSCWGCSPSSSIRANFECTYSGELEYISIFDTI